MKEKIKQYLRGSVSRRRFLSGLGAMGVASIAASPMAHTLAPFQATGIVDPGNGVLPPDVAKLMQALANAFAANGGVGQNFRVIRAVLSSNNEVDPNGRVRTVRLNMGTANTCCVWRWSNGTLECDENC